MGIAELVLSAASGPSVAIVAFVILWAGELPGRDITAPAVGALLLITVAGLNAGFVHSHSKFLNYAGFQTGLAINILCFAVALTVLGRATRQAIRKQQQQS